MDILGHNAIRTTMDIIYAHVMPEAKQEAVDIMDQILNHKRREDRKQTALPYLKLFFFRLLSNKKSCPI
jgi:hypothetical protein